MREYKAGVIVGLIVAVFGPLVGALPYLILIFLLTGFDVNKMYLGYISIVIYAYFLGSIPSTISGAYVGIKIYRHEELILINLLGLVAVIFLGGLSYLFLTEGISLQDPRSEGFIFSMSLYLFSMLFAAFVFWRSRRWLLWKIDRYY